MATTRPLQQQPFFSIPLDAEGKATEFRPLSISPPHMRAFLAWLSLFVCFFSTSSIPPLTPLIPEDLNLTQSDIGRASIASFVGSIFSRLAMGPIRDVVGPLTASATLSLATAPIILATSLVNYAAGFILVRFLVGFCWANFVANQFSMSSMFSGCVVGLANGVAAGWANVGAGMAQLVMPQIYNLITSFDVGSSTAWRLCFIIPAVFQAVTALTVLAFGQDLPTGSLGLQVLLKQASGWQTGSQGQWVACCPTSLEGGSACEGGCRGYGWYRRRPGCCVSCLKGSIR